VTDIEIVKLLVSVDADVNAKTKFGFTSLDIAKEENNIDAVEYLSNIK
jgi:hypothetical protein